MRVLIGFVTALAAGYVLVVALLFVFQNQIVYPATTQRVSAAGAGLVDFQDVEIVTEDGERLVGWWRPPDEGRALVLYFHGNGGSLLDRRDRVRMLAEGGRGVLIVSYRGYSGSSGSPSEAGLSRDADAAWRWLGSYQPNRIALYGESLGSAVAVRLAAERPVGGVILDSPFTSLLDVARPGFRFVPLDLLLTNRFPSIERIGAIRGPLLVMHGDRDGVVPIALGERLFAAASEPKRFVRLAGVDHVSVLESGGLASARAFLDESEARWRAGIAPAAEDSRAAP